MEKEAFRSKYRDKRMNLSLEERRIFSELISNSCLKYLENNRSIQHVHLFLPIKRFFEVDTFPLLYALQEKGFKVYTSKVNPKTQLLETIDISETKLFKEDKWGIPFPIDASLTTREQIQLLFMPLLAFDQRGYRLGYGKGYYDKYLAGFSQTVTKVGLSFFEPEPFLPEEPHDIPLNFCITPKYFFTF